MDIFLSWSGGRSRAIAKALRAWLPKVMTPIKPWISTVDVEQGALWNDAINSGLSKSKAGVICLTKSNLDKGSILFEAGAISRRVDKARVYTLLSDLEPSDLAWPLAQFQATRLIQVDLRKMCKDLNSAILQSGEESIPYENFDESFDVWWPKLEVALAQLPSETDPLVPSRTEREIMEEMLELLRAQNRVLSTPGLHLVSSSSETAYKASTLDTDMAELAKDELQMIQQILSTDLEAAGYNTAASLLSNAEWRDNRSVITVRTGVRGKMLSLTVNPECVKLLADTLRQISIKERMILVPIDWDQKLESAVVII